MKCWTRSPAERDSQIWLEPDLTRELRRAATKSDAGKTAPRDVTSTFHERALVSKGMRDSFGKHLPEPVEGPAGVEAQLIDAKMYNPLRRPMPELVTIPISFFEIAIDYARPDIRVLGDRVPLVEQVLAVLLPYNVTLDDIEVLTTGKLSEQGVAFKVPQQDITFFVGATMAKFTRSRVSWDVVRATLGILEALLGVLAKLSTVPMGRQRTTLAVHLQPKTAPFQEILRPLIPSPFSELGDANFSTMANITKWGDHAITIDGSATIANGIYLKLERTFADSVTLADIATQIRKDELEVFAALGIEEATS